MSALPRGVDEQTKHHGNDCQIANCIMKGELITDNTITKLCTRHTATEESFH